MVSDVVKTLEARKLILRRSHPDDGRSFSLLLTDSARSLLKKAVPVVEAVDESFSGEGALSLAQRKEFSTALICLAVRPSKHHTNP